MKKVIPHEARVAASNALMELARSMTQSAASMMRQSGRLMIDDPAAYYRVPGTIRKFAKSGLPGSDQMDHIEARLLGKSAEECKSDREKAREENRARQARQHEIWTRVMEGENAFIEQCRVFCRNPMDDYRVRQALGEGEGYERLREKMQREFCKQIEEKLGKSNVTAGPWKGTVH